MSLALTLKDSKALSADAIAVSSSAFTPAASSLVFVFLNNDKASAPDAPTLSTPSWLNGAWNAAGDVTHGSVNMRQTGWWGYANSTTSSDLVAATFGGVTQIGFTMHCIEVTGASGANGVRQFKTGSASSVTTVTTSLSAALAATSSIVLAAFVINSNAVQGQGDAETELGDTGHAAPTRGMMSQYKVNDTSSVATFTTSSVVWIAVELVEATGGSALTASFSDTVTLSEAVVKAPGLVKADTATVTDAAAKLFGSARADSLTLSDAATKAVSKPQADTVTSSDAATKAVSKPVADTVTVTDAASKGVGKPQSDTVTTTDAASKAVGKTAADTVTLQDQASGFFPPASPKQRTLRGAGK